MDREQFLALLARFRGDGDPLTVDELNQLSAYVTEHSADREAVTADELGEVRDLCRALGEDDEVTIPALQAAVAVVTAIDTAAAARDEEDAAEQAERDALRLQLLGEQPADEAGDDEAGDGDGAGEGEAGGDGEAGEGDGGAGDAGTGDGAGDGGDGAGAAGDGGAGDAEREPVGAATAAGGAGGAGTGTRARSVPTTLRRPGGEHQPGRRRLMNRIRRDGGGEFDTLDTLGEQMVERRASFLSGNQSGVAEKVTIGSILAEFQDDRILDPEQPALTARRLSAVTASVHNQPADTYDAAVASGGFCAPAMPYYGIMQLATASRPFRAGLQQFDASRGRITHRVPPAFLDFSTAVAIWTGDNDALPGSAGPTTKPCLRVECPELADSEVYAVTECLEYGNFMARTDPETVRNATDNTLAAFARKAEVRLIDLMKAASTPVNGGAVLGAYRDLLYQIGVAALGYRSRERMDMNAVLEIRLPAWAWTMARFDLMRGMPGDGTLAGAQQWIDRFLAENNLRVASLYIDSPTSGVQQVFGPQHSGSLVDFPAAVQWQLSSPGSFFLLDNGRLDVGVIRDSALVETNDYRTFAESFEGLAYMGVASYWVTSTVCPNGQAAALVDTELICAGEYVPV